MRWCGVVNPMIGSGTIGGGDGGRRRHDTTKRGDGQPIGMMRWDTLTAPAVVASARVGRSTGGVGTGVGVGYPFTALMVAENRTAEEKELVASLTAEIELLTTDGIEAKEKANAYVRIQAEKLWQQGVKIEELVVKIKTATDYARHVLLENQSLEERNKRLEEKNEMLEERNQMLEEITEAPPSSGSTSTVEADVDEVAKEHAAFLNCLVNRLVMKTHNAVHESATKFLKTVAEATDEMNNRFVAIVLAFLYYPRLIVSVFVPLAPSTPF